LANVTAHEKEGLSVPSLCSKGTMLGCIAQHGAELNFSPFIAGYFTPNPAE
jgi:hypothetical protein